MNLKQLFLNAGYRKIKDEEDSNLGLGTKYTQFKGKPKDAIKYLMEVQEGDCVDALYREDVGYVDIVWGENDENNKGFGLKHIIEKHGAEINQLGYKIEDFIAIAFEFGDFKKAKEKEKILLESEMFRVVIAIEWKGHKKSLLLSAFDLRKKPKS